MCKIRISAFKLDKRRVYSMHNSSIVNSIQNNAIVHTQTELDSYADPIVARSNCCIVHYTNR